MADLPDVRFTVSGQAPSSQLSLATPDVIPPPACVGCRRQQRAIDALTVDLENAEVALRVERRRVKALLKEIDELRGAGIPHESIEAIFECWRVLCRPKARTCNGKRRAVVQARLRDGYTHEDFALAILGAAAYPYQRDGVIYDDLELIARDATKMDSFIAKGREANAEHSRILEPAWRWRLQAMIDQFQTVESPAAKAQLERKLTDIYLKRTAMLRELANRDHAS